MSIKKSWGYFLRTVVISSLLPVFAGAGADAPNPTKEKQTFFRYGEVAEY